MEKICIIVPVYNREATLERCVRSIINQTYTDWVLLLVNDGSTDASARMCDAFAEKDSRIQVLHKENGGVSSARNAGLDWAFAHDQSEWIAFIDSDDWVNPAYFQRLFEAAEMYHTDISACDYVELSEEIPHQPEPVRYESLTTEQYWTRYASPSVVPWGKIYKKSLFVSVRYPLGKICDDTFTTHRVLFQRNVVAWVQEKLYCYFVSSDGISRNRNAKLWLQWCEAYEAQAIFFHEKNLCIIRNTAIRRMLSCKLSAIESAELDLSEKKALKRDLNRQLHWARKELGISLYGNEYIYEAAMPRRAALSRAWRHFKRDVRKLLSNGR